MTRTSRVWKVLDAIACLTIIGWTLYSSLGTNVFGSVPWPGTMVDFRAVYDSATEIGNHMPYRQCHAYPPSAIVMHLAATHFSFAQSGAFYLALTTLAALACWFVLARTVQPDQRPGLTVLVLLALVLSNHYFHWDLRSQNTNTIFLLAVLLGGYFLVRERPMAAGFWLAFSLAWKLFSVFLMPYLLWRRKFRAFAWALAFTAVFWIALPALVFGWARGIEVYSSWIEQMGVVSKDRADLENTASLISLHNAAHRLTDGDRWESSLIVNSFRAAWLAVALAGMAASWQRKDVPGDAFGTLTDFSLLTLGPMAVSPFLEPFHPMPLAIPALLLLITVSDNRQGKWVRGLALLAYLTSLTLTAIPTSWEIRGIIVNLRLLAASSGLVAVAWLRQSFPAGQCALSPAESMNYSANVAA